MASGDDSGLLEELKRSGIDEENQPTSSSIEQLELEKNIYKQYEKMLLERGYPVLEKKATEKYLLSILSGSSLPEFEDCNRTWHCYWAIHSLSLLKKKLDDSLKSQVINFLNLCQNKTGGYGGSPGNISDLGCTYAAINALVIIGTVEAYKSINRESLLQFFISLRVGDGSFYMHEGGEIDIRAIYCAVSIAKLIDVQNEDLFRDSKAWIGRCQTYEGGFGSKPGTEAHGGYTFCAVSALFLLDGMEIPNMKTLLRWIANRQMSYGGGFQGRPNELVDSCYSFWLAGAIAIVNINLLATKRGRKYLVSGRWIFESNLLQHYILICCQHKKGGLVNKPQMNRDAFQTCYGLSGLALAQHQITGERFYIGNDANILEYIHPAYNISFQKVYDVNDYFIYSKKMYKSTNVHI